MDGGSHTVATGLFVFWILTFAAWAQNELLWQVLLFSVLHECGHLTALCALGLQPRQLRLSFTVWRCGMTGCRIGGETAVLLAARR